MKHQQLMGMASSIIIAGIGLTLLVSPAPLYTGGDAGTIICDSDRECEEATGYPYDTALDGGPKYPVLVGLDCEGAGGPLYAFEEDHFPEGGCRAIWPMDWDWQEKMP